MEATPGFEPGDHGFANQCLTAWLCRLVACRSDCVPFPPPGYASSSQTALHSVFATLLILSDADPRYARHRWGRGMLTPRQRFVCKCCGARVLLCNWSGRRGSNSLPPPWQGGALPDELRPHKAQYSDYITHGASGRNRINDMWIFNLVYFGKCQTELQRRVVIFNNSHVHLAITVKMTSR